MELLGEGHRREKAKTKHPFHVPATQSSRAQLAVLRKQHESDCLLEVVPGLTGSDRLRRVMSAAQVQASRLLEGDLTTS